jgi:acetylornithine deacetylase/succinyl-diaminopimelate desuccinylase-like protein
LKGIEKMVEPLQRHAREVLGVAIKPTGVPLYTDARHYAAHKIPIVLYGAGPRSILEANAHRADEHVRIKDLEAAIQIVALTLRDLLRP